MVYPKTHSSVQRNGSDDDLELFLKKCFQTALSCSPSAHICSAILLLWMWYPWHETAQKRPINNTKRWFSLNLMLQTSHFLLSSCDMVVITFINNFRDATITSTFTDRNICQLLWYRFHMLSTFLTSPWRHCDVMKIFSLVYMNMNDTTARSWLTKWSVQLFDRPSHSITRDVDKIVTYIRHEELTLHIYWTYYFRCI